MIYSVDTNVLIYAHDERDPVKLAIARDLLARLSSKRALIALQVIGEFQFVLRRKLKLPVPAVAAQARAVYMQYPSFDYDHVCVGQALDDMVLGQLSYWDALLLRACDHAGVQVLFSEDMQDGFRFGGLTIINPFGPEGLSPSAQSVLES